MQLVYSLVESRIKEIMGEKDDFDQIMRVVRQNINSSVAYTTYTADLTQDFDYITAFSNKLSSFPHILAEERTHGEHPCKHCEKNG